MKRLERNLKYKGSVISVYADKIELPEGKIVEWDYIHHNGATAIVPVLEDGRILMVRQFRNALDRETLEIPAGKLDSVDEIPKECARRELEEETGYYSDKLEWLIDIRTWVAFTNEKIFVYVASGLKKTEQRLDEDEFVDVEAYTIEELKELIYTGKIEDSKTIASLLAYDTKYNKVN